MTDLHFHHHSAASAREHRETVESIYRRSYKTAIDSGDPFESPESFMHRFDAYTDPDRAAGFDLVIVTLDDIAIGQTWGWPLPPGTAWWTGLELDDAALNHGAFTRETGKRTFALSEIMVDQTHTGHGIAHALHDEILGERLEERATLLVDPENPRAYSAYRNWGWSRVGTLTPTWDGAPTFDVLIRSHSS